MKTLTSSKIWACPVRYVESYFELLSEALYQLFLPCLVKMLSRQFFTQIQWKFTLNINRNEIVKTKSTLTWIWHCSIRVVALWQRCRCIWRIWCVRRRPIWHWHPLGVHRIRQWGTRNRLWIYQKYNKLLIIYEKHQCCDHIDDNNKKWVKLCSGKQWHSMQHKRTCTETVKVMSNKWPRLTIDNDYPPEWYDGCTGSTAGPCLLFSCVRSFSSSSFSVFRAKQ